MEEVRAHLRLISPPGPFDAPLPVTIGVPFARGAWDGGTPLGLARESKAAAEPARPAQHEILDRWSDGSVRWALFDFALPVGTRTGDSFFLERRETELPPPDSQVRVEELSGAFLVHTGRATFRLARGVAVPFASVLDAASRELLDAGRSRLVAHDGEGRAFTATIRNVAIECAGPLRASARLTGAFVGDGAGRPLLDFILRIQFYAGRASTRHSLTVRNARRALHPGGHWELGDAGSILVRDLALTLAPRVSHRVSWTAEPGRAVLERDGADISIHQDSSGGEHWQSRVHLDRHREVPLRFRGYRERTPADGSGAADVREGRRAAPWISVHDAERGVALAPRWFWQNFPKSIEARGGALTLGFFPFAKESLHEIQGGEQKTHEFVLALGEEALSLDRGLPADPPIVAPTPETFASSEAIPFLTARKAGAPSLHDRLVDQALEGDDTIDMKRENVDEYGWRHFGELPADHEARYHEGPGEFVSHYNNQYDVVYGAFLQFARTGDPRWHRIHEELARHVVDIDIYHTTEDKAAYNQGLFWHTVHYVDADLSTHRSYPKRGSNGGGPDDEHNYTTGLLHRYFASGDPLARETVLASATWVIDADDGGKTVLRWIDRGATGLATKTREFGYHGPGRGAGNSLNALLDGWRLSGDSRFLDKAREVLRRAIHPADDVAARRLLDAENRWSYTVFLQALGKYLDVLEERGGVDVDFAYARAALLAYARWMASHERPILDVPETLEFPTETWAAQDVRKSDVFLFAALHTDGDERERFLERARFFFDHSLNALDGFATKSCTRSVILLMHYGMMKFWFDENPRASRARGPASTDFGRPGSFVPQKTRALAKLKRLAAFGAAVFIVAVASAAFFLARR